MKHQRPGTEDSKDVSKKVFSLFYTIKDIKIYRTNVEICFPTAHFSEALKPHVSSRTTKHLSALHQKICAKELVESSIKEAFLSHFNRSGKSPAVKPCNDNSYNSLLQKYEELAIVHFKLKRKYEDAMSNLHHHTVSSVEEKVELKRTIVDLQKKLKTERLKAYEQLYEEGIRVKHENAVLDDSISPASSGLESMRNIKDTAAACFRGGSEHNYNLYQGQLDDTVLSCLQKLIDTCDNKNIKMSSLIQENQRFADKSERLQAQVKRLKNEKFALNEKYKFLKAHLNKSAVKSASSNHTSSPANPNVVSNKIILPQMKKKPKMKDMIIDVGTVAGKQPTQLKPVISRDKKEEKVSNVVQTTSILKAKGKSKELVFVDSKKISDQEQQIKRLQDQLRELEASNSMLKGEIKRYHVSNRQN